MNSTRYDDVSVGIQTELAAKQQRAQPKHGLRRGEIDDDESRG
jgi:hypothetical protein